MLERSAPAAPPCPPEARLACAKQLAMHSKAQHGRAPSWGNGGQGGKAGCEHKEDGNKPASPLPGEAAGEGTLDAPVPGNLGMTFLLRRRFKQKKHDGTNNHLKLKSPK